MIARQVNVRQFKLQRTSVSAMDESLTRPLTVSSASELFSCVISAQWRVMRDSARKQTRLRVMWLSTRMIDDNSLSTFYNYFAVKLVPFGLQEKVWVCAKDFGWLVLPGLRSTQLKFEFICILTVWSPKQDMDVLEDEIESILYIGREVSGNLSLCPFLIAYGL
jgi:hypothetical protein